MVRRSSGSRTYAGNVALHRRRDDAMTAPVSFHMRTFWGAPAYLVDSFFLRKFVAHRLFPWGPGYQYVTHRPRPCSMIEGAMCER